MATKIRLMRLGAMKRPFYRLVVVDSRNRRDGRYIENLGTYNPIPKETEVNLKEDRILHWLGEGAQLTKTAESLVRGAGILEKFHLVKAGLSSEELESKLSELKTKQPQASGEKLSRADKKAQKKQAARDEAAAASAEEAAASAESSHESDSDGDAGAEEVKTPTGENAEA